jgi:hypothetical protein
VVGITRGGAHKVFHQKRHPGERCCLQRLGGIDQGLFEALVYHRVERRVKRLDVRNRGGHQFARAARPSAECGGLTHGIERQDIEVVHGCIIAARTAAPKARSLVTGCLGLTHPRARPQRGPRRRLESVRGAPQALVTSRNAGLLLTPYTRRAPPGERKKNFMTKSSPPDLGVFLRAVHLGLAIMLGLASLPFFAAAVYGWWTADQFSGFANYEQLMMTTARDALIKGAICAAGALWLLVLWRSQHNARRRG